jgi:hypothetical protein
MFDECIPQSYCPNSATSGCEIDIMQGENGQAFIGFVWGRNEVGSGLSSGYLRSLFVSTDRLFPCLAYMVLEDVV